MITEELIKQCMDSGFFKSRENAIRYLNQVMKPEITPNLNGLNIVEEEPTQEELQNNVILSFNTDGLL